MTISEVSGDKVTGNRLESTLRLAENISLPSTSSSSIIGMVTETESVVDVNMRVSVVGS